FGNRTMSITPTAGSAAPNRSGRWFRAAPTNRPPFDPPWIASFGVDVYLFAISHSPAAMKSSKTFCFLSFAPFSHHSLPYSLPPRRFATAYTPPITSHGIRATENPAVIGTLKPPYPYRIVGFVPSSLRPFLCVMNIGTRVPSLLV